MQPKRLTKTFERSRYGHVVIGDVLYGKGGSFGPRRQSDFQLVVLHGGSLILTLDGKQIVVPEQHAILLSPGHNERFVFAADRETRHTWIALDASAASEELKQEFALHPGPFPFIGRMAKLLDLARGSALRNTPISSLQVKFYESLALSVLLAFTSAVAEGGSSHARDSALWRMERFISEAYAHSLTLNDIARAASVSRQHLLKLCRHAEMPTPMTLLYNKRLEVASDLLLHTGFSVAEVAVQSGFTNQFHFSRKFKQSMGTSPKQWRGRLWQHNDEGRT